MTKRTKSPASPKSAPRAETPFGCAPGLQHTVLSGYEQSVGFYVESWKSVPLAGGLSHVMADTEMAAYGLAIVLDLIHGDAEATEYSNDEVGGDIPVEVFNHRQRMQLCFAAHCLSRSVIGGLAELREHYADGKGDVA